MNFAAQSAHSSSTPRRLLTTTTSYFFQAYRHSNVVADFTAHYTFLNNFVHCLHDDLCLQKYFTLQDSQFVVVVKSLHSVKDEWALHSCATKFRQVMIVDR